MKISKELYLNPYFFNELIEISTRDFKFLKKFNLLYFLLICQSQNKFLSLLLVSEFFVIL